MATATQATHLDLHCSTYSRGQRRCILCSTVVFPQKIEHDADCALHPGATKAAVLAEAKRAEDGDKYYHSALSLLASGMDHVA